MKFILNIFKVVFWHMRQLLMMARIQSHFPSLILEFPSVIRVDELSAIEIGKKVHIGAFSEIVVLHKTDYSDVEGRLEIGNRVVIGCGANIRAAGGLIHISNNALLAQNVTLIAANHILDSSLPYRDAPWDSNRIGINLGENVWVGANVLILPGTTVGKNSVIAAGSVVIKDVPPSQVWGGVPAKFIKNC